MDFPPPVGIRTIASRPARTVSMIASCSSLNESYPKRCRSTSRACSILGSCLTWLDLNFVYLSLLQLAAVVDVKRFPLCEYIENLCACFAMPIARSLRSPERQVNLSTDGRGIHIADPRVELLHRVESLI